MSFGVSSRPLAAVKARLADEPRGINRWLLDLATGHGVKAVRLEFGPRSNNVLSTLADVDELAATGRLRYDPLICNLFCPSSANTGRVKHRTFSGTSVVQIDLHYSWTTLPLEAESVANYLEAALYACLLDRWEDAEDEAAVFDGSMAVQKSPLRQGRASNWLMTVAARLSFTVDDTILN